MQEPIGYNVTHDNGVVAMAFSVGKSLFPDPPAYRVGLDVMLLQLPKRDTFPGFVEIFSEQVRIVGSYIVPLLMSFGLVDVSRTNDTSPTCISSIALTPRAATTVLPHMDAEGSIY